VTAITKLIKFHRFQLDEKRRGLKELEDQAAKIEELLANLISQVQAEKELASKNFDMQRDYPNFIRASLEQQVQLSQDLAAVRGRVETAREEVREAFAAVKKFEITKQNHDAEVAEEAERREQINLDEVALTNHRLRQ
jgi:flagellar export protein FliJ